MDRVSSPVLVVVIVMLALCEVVARGGLPHPPPPRSHNNNKNNNNKNDLYVNLNNGPATDKYQSYSVSVNTTTGNQLRTYAAGGKWLKIQTRPYLTDYYYQEIQEYINGNNSFNKPLALGTPMLIRIDLKPEHLQRFARYQYFKSQVVGLRQSVTNRLLQQQKQLARRGGQTLTLEQVATPAEKVAMENLTETASNELLALVGDNSVTVFSYLNEAYHANPPQPRHPDLTVITAPKFTVYSKTYVDWKGIEQSYEAARNLTSELGRPLTSYYVADYMFFFTGIRSAYYYEVWVSQNPAYHALS